MGNLDSISRMTYLADMSILYGKVNNLESKVDYLMDKVTKYEVERLDDIKRHETKGVKKATKKKTTN